MERYAIIIRPNEETVLLHCYPGDSLDLKALQEIVEGHIETVPTALAGEWSHEQGVGLTLIINEEGKLLGMPVNRLATDMAYLFNDAIVGNAILIGTTDEDFIGLTKEAAENIMEKWRKQIQSDRNEIYYTACWRELQSFLAEVVRDDTGEYPQAADFLKLMKSIERKVESDAE